MRRAQLNPAEVTRIIVTASMTAPMSTVTPYTELNDRRAEGAFDHGWHYLITADGVLHEGVPFRERGSLFQRYSTDSVIIKIVGGIDKKGNAARTYSVAQMQALRHTINFLQSYYDQAAVTMHCDLFKGVNPMLSIEDI